MNSLKKVAAITAIISGIALLLTIILTPFAVSGVIDTYNNIIEKAENSVDDYWIQKDLKGQVTELTISYPEYFGSIFIEKSADQKIHILTQDWGFEYLLPDVSYNGYSAILDFNWKHDYKLNEENILQFIAQEVSPMGPRGTIIQLPDHVSLKLNENYMDSLYYTLDFVSCDFANYEEIRQQLDDWYKQHQTERIYNDFINIVNNELNEISRCRNELADSAERWVGVENFQSYASPIYHDIKNRRSDLLKRAYNFRKEYGSQTQEELDSVYLEFNQLIEELYVAEREYDILSAKVNEAHRKLSESEMSEHQFSSIAEQCYTQQVELDLTISKLREKFEAYLYAEIPLWEAGETRVGADGVPETTPSEVMVPVETPDVDAPVSDVTPSTETATPSAA